MDFFLILLFAWCTHGEESVILRSAFTLNTSIYDEDNAIYRTYGSRPGYESYKYREKLCEWLVSRLPSNITKTTKGTTEVCTARQLSEPHNHTIKWKIEFSLLTVTPTGPLINLTCPTFVELFKYYLTNIVPKFYENKLQFNVHDYSPHPNPFDPKEATDVVFDVNAYLCDYERKTIPVGDFDKYNETHMKNVIKQMYVVGIGQPLTKSPEVQIPTLTKTMGSDKIFIQFQLLYPMHLVQMLRINPYCDTANMLQMILTDAQGQIDIFLCGVTVKGPPAPTVAPITTSPATSPATSTTTTALASTSRRPMELLVCGFILSHILANI